MKRRVLPQILSGEKICSLAITEPCGGSDVANLATTARRDGDHYVVNGSKTFITSGMRADFTPWPCAPAAPGRGVSLAPDRGRTRGLRAPAQEDGLVGSDTATLYFDDLPRARRKPDRPGGRGFSRDHAQLQRRAPRMAAGATGRPRLPRRGRRLCAERRTFGKRLIEHQVIRHKLVDMAMRVEASQAIWNARPGGSSRAKTRSPTSAC